MGFLWLGLAVCLLAGIGWFVGVRKRGTAGLAAPGWPEEGMEAAVVRQLLSDRDPWEVAEWLTANFTSSRELWPALAELIHELGYEGIYLAAINPSGQGLAASNRELALKALGLIGTVKSLPLLFAALASKDELLSWNACRTLKQLKNPECIPRLLEELLHPGRILPARSAEILSALGSQASAAISSALQSADAEARRVLLEVLGEFKDAAYLPVLAAYLNDPDDGVRLKAVEAVAGLAVPASCPYLIGALGDSFWRVRAVAARALGYLRCEAAIMPLGKLSLDPEWLVRTNAVEALEQLGAASLVNREG